MWVGVTGAPGARAMTTTGGLQSLTWSVSGIADSDLAFDSRQETSRTVTEVYRAPYLVGRGVNIHARFPKVAIGTNTIPYQRNLSGAIPFGRYVMRSELEWTPDCGLPEDLELYQSDTFSPNRRYDFFAIEAFAFDLNTNGTAGPTMQFLIKIYPSEKYQVTNEEWVKGLPEYDEIRKQTPVGSGACSSMGLPTWRVSASACNLLIEDTDFSYPVRGPGVELKRYYNADPTVVGMFGRSWSFEYDSSIDAVPLGARLRKGSGQVVTHTVGDLAINTNYVMAEPVVGAEDLVFITVTNRLGPVVGRCTLSDYVYPPDWNGTLVPPPGEADWMTYRYETNSGRHVYSLVERDTRWTWCYESTNRYAENNWLTSVTDLNSNRLSIQRTASGRITNIVDAVGRAVAFQYNAAGYCTNMTVPGGGRFSFTYDASGNLLSSRDLLGNISQYRYDANHYVTNIVTGSAHWAIRWNDGFAEAVICPLGYSNTYYRQPMSATNRWTWHRDAYGRQTQYVSDFGRSTRVIDPDGYGRRIAYDTNGLPVSVTNALGYARRMSYDGRRNLTVVADFTGATNRYAYTTNDWLSAITNALGRVYRYEYDARGNLTNVVWPSGRRMQAAYDARGHATSVTDPDGHTTILAYTPLGRLASVTDPAGHVTRFGYDATGINLTAVTNARGQVTRLEHDAHRRLLRIVHPDGSVRSNQYDGCAQTGATDEEGRTWTVQRNAMLRPTQRADPLGRVTRFTYDATGARASFTNPAGYGRTYSNDFRGRPVEMLNSYGDKTRFSRDTEGRVAMLYPTTNLYKEFIYWVEPQYQFTYDGEGRVVADTSRRSAYTRDALGRIVNRRNGRLQDIGFTYDEDGRLVTRTHYGAPIVSNAYDLAGRLASVSDGTGTTRFERDPRGLVRSITWPEGLGASFEYDAVGQESTIAYPGGPTVAYQRDSRDRVTNMTWSGGSLGFTLDRVGNVLYTRMGNGARAVFSYDAVHRLTNLLHSSATTIILELRYQRDVLGKTTNVVKTAGVAPWSPPMTAASVTAGHNASFGFTNWNAGAPTYDNDKNLTGLTGDRPLTAAYDPDNRATSITLNGTNQTYVYNGLGDRVRVTKAGTIRNLYYDHRHRLLFESDSSSSITARYFYRGRRLVAMQDASGTHYYHFDARGSTLAMTDPAGKISALYRYLPYGATAGGYSRVANPFTFVGEYGVVDDGDGLYFMVTRYYDAVLRRFLSWDRIGTRGGPNLYEYVRGSPLDFIDPLGLDEDNPSDTTASGTAAVEEWCSIRRERMDNLDYRYPDEDAYLKDEERIKELERIMMQTLPPLPEKLDLGPKSQEMVAGIDVSRVYRPPGTVAEMQELHRAVTDEGDRKEPPKPGGGWFGLW